MAVVGVFANTLGDNNAAVYFAGFLETKTEFHIISIAEDLPKYLHLANQSRASRIESILNEAGQSAINAIIDRLKEKNFSSIKTQLIPGHFPTNLIEWSEKHKTDLIIKEPIPVAESTDNPVKGEIKFSRSCKVPLLIANQSSIGKKDILVGVAPDSEDKQGTAPWFNLVDKAASWAAHLGGDLHIVYAWQVWAENLLRSKMQSDQVQEMLNTQKESAQGKLNVIEKYAEKFKNITTTTHLVKGDPTRGLEKVAKSIGPGLIVLGDVARTGLQGYLLGNTAEAFIRSKQFSILIEPFNDQ